MRILCVGDSLGLPRENVRYEDTWYYMLCEYFPDCEIIDMYERGLLISKAIDNFDSYYVFYPSEIVIIQTGICDCAPRYFDEKKLLWKLVIKCSLILNIDKYFWRLVKKGGRKASITSTPINTFRVNYRKLVEKFIKIGCVKKVVLVKIGHGDNRIIQKSVFFNNNVDKYNVVLDEIKEEYGNKIITIDPLNYVDENITVDGYHCSPRGNEIVFNELRSIIKEELEIINKFNKDMRDNG